LTVALRGPTRRNLTRADRVKARAMAMTGATERAPFTDTRNRPDRSPPDLETIRGKMAGCIARPGRWT
jgi:hypothetical protein